MKPLHIVFIFIIISLASYGQTRNKATDIQSVDSIKLRLTNIDKELGSLKRVNDSLNKELYYYRAKDDFYAAAVDKQGTHFDTLFNNQTTHYDALLAILFAVLAIISSLVGVFSVRFIYQRIDKVQEHYNSLLESVAGHIEKQTVENERLQENIDEATVALWGELSASAYNQAFHYISLGDPVLSLDYAMKSVYNAFRAYEITTSHKRSAFTISNFNVALEYANHLLDECRKSALDPENGKEVLNKAQYLLSPKLLESLLEYEQFPSQTLVGTFLVRLKEFLQKE